MLLDDDYNLLLEGFVDESSLRIDVQSEGLEIDDIYMKRDMFIQVPSRNIARIEARFKEPWKNKGLYNQYDPPLVIN